MSLITYCKLKFFKCGILLRLSRKIFRLFILNSEIINPKSIKDLNEISHFLLNIGNELFKLNISPLMLNPRFVKFN